MYITLEECRKQKKHLKSCDEDGYCNFCGEQDSMVIRICLHDDGSVNYAENDGEMKAITHKDALQMMRNGVPVVVAISAGDDKISNFENTEAVVLDKV